MCAVQNYANFTMVLEVFFRREERKKRERREKEERKKREKRKKRREKTSGSPRQLINLTAPIDGLH